MTPSITVEPVAGDMARRPGETLEMVARWSLAAPPQRIVARLCWYTRGKGTPDASIVAERALGGSGLTGEGNFAFTLPAGPYSFSGHLITLAWNVEVVIDDELTGSWAFVLSPNGKELLLDESPPAHSQLQIDATASRVR